jgi:hypothetical protein
MTALEKFTAKIKSLKTVELMKIIEKCMTDYREESEIIMKAASNELEKRLSDKEVAIFYNSL